MGNWFIKLLIAEYIIASFLFILEGNFPKALYWISAAFLSLAILLMR